MRQKAFSFLRLKLISEQTFKRFEKINVALKIKASFFISSFFPFFIPVGLRRVGCRSSSSKVGQGIPMKHWARADILHVRSERALEEQDRNALSQTWLHSRVKEAPALGKQFVAFLGYETERGLQFPRVWNEKDNIINCIRNLRLNKNVATFSAEQLAFSVFPISLVLTRETKERENRIFYFIPGLTLRQLWKKQKTNMWLKDLLLYQALGFELHLR